MLNVDAAFDRIGSALRERGYAVTQDERPGDAPGDRVVVFESQDMHVRVRWHGKPRMLTLHVHVDDEWVEFARRNFGPAGLEETSVDALVRAVRNEVAETSTDSDAAS
jgi:hypothetical protein